MKQLFQYGVKEMSTKGDKIFISLTYSPRAQTLKRKFGNLPIRYMRVRNDQDDDFKILERVVKRYQFNLLDEEVDSIQQQQQQRITAGNKRKLYLEPLVIDDEYDDDDNNDINNSNDTNNGGENTPKKALISSSSAAAVRKS